jgi:glycerol-3-phosphate acyltransferase PlsX
VDAIISAGNTGACVAACQMRLRRLRGVHRPGIAVICPTFYGPVAMCDVGANVSCRPQHLHQYAIMASEYLRAICQVENARVGLLSIGQEDAKGNELVKQTRELLRQDPAINFIGNAEGRDVFRGTCDVMICEGFVGNVCLKLIEGLTEGLFKSMFKEMATQKPRLMAEFEAVIKIIRSKWDFNEYGGAPLLGINGICIILHGASHYRAFVNGLRVARESAAARINDRIIDRIRQLQGLVNE